MIAFLLCLSATIIVLLPHELVFSFRGRALLGASGHEGIHDVTEVYRAAGAWIQLSFESNRRKIAGLSNWFTASCVLLAAEVILWTLSLAS